MHSLVIDGWPFYIGLGLFFTHLYFYWFNQWRKYRNRSFSNDVPVTLLMINLYKKIQSLEKRIEQKKPEKPAPPAKIAPEPPKQQIVEDYSPSVKQITLKKKYVVKRSNDV